LYEHSIYYKHVLQHNHTDILKALCTELFTKNKNSSINHCQCQKSHITYVQLL